MKVVVGTPVMWGFTIFFGFLLLIVLVSGVVDVCTRQDIGRGKKALWLLAFLVFFPIVLIGYSVVRIKRQT
jgi:hypothetical protein